MAAAIWWICKIFYFEVYERRNSKRCIDKDNFFHRNKNNLVICDDLITLSADNQKIADLFSEGAHCRNLSIANFAQNLFTFGKHANTHRRNILLFKLPTRMKIKFVIWVRLFPGQLQSFLNVYYETIEQLYAHLIIDNKTQYKWWL